MNEILCSLKVRFIGRRYTKNCGGLYCVRFPLAESLGIIDAYRGPQTNRGESQNHTGLPGARLIRDADLRTGSMQGSMQ